jgi:hypothetical protein
MANAQLIQMAKDIGKSKGFVDVGAEFEKSFSKWVGVAEAATKERRDKRDAGIARTTAWMDKMPSHASIPKVPAYAQEAVGSWLKDQRKAYGDAARAVKDLDPLSEEYQAQVGSMNKITQSMANLNDQFTSLLDDKVKFMDSVNEDSLSHANSPEDVDLLSTVYTDAATMGISEDGRLDFNGKSFDELPKMHAKNSEIPIALTQLNAKYYKTNRLIEGPMAKSLQLEVEQIIKSSGRPGIMSLAADSDLGIDPELIKDPARYEELVDKMVDTWVSAITESAKIGKEQSDADWKLRHPIKKNTPAYVLDKYFLDMMNNKNKTE